MHGLERVRACAGELERVSLAAVDDRAEQLSPRRPRAGATTRGTARRRERASSVDSAAPRRSSSKARTAASLADPEGREPAAHLVRGQPAAESAAGEHLAREPALGLPRDALAHQLERDHDRAPAARRAARSPRARRSADDHQPGLGGAAAGRDTGWASARPATEGCDGHEGVRRRRRGCTSSRIASTRSRRRARGGRAPASPRRARRARRAAADRGGDLARDLVEAALLQHQPLEPLVGPRCPRESTSYCSLTSRLKAASVIAMNGVS